MEEKEWREEKRKKKRKWDQGGSEWGRAGGRAGLRDKLCNKDSNFHSQIPVLAELKTKQRGEFLPSFFFFLSRAGKGGEGKSTGVWPQAAQLSDNSRREWRGEYLAPHSPVAERWSMNECLLIIYAVFSLPPFAESNEYDFWRCLRGSTWILEQGSFIGNRKKI